MTGGWIAAAIAIVVWGVTFASTRVLLADFSAFEILVLRFLIAWVVLAVGGVIRRARRARPTEFCRYPPLVKCAEEKLAFRREAA